MKIDRNKPCHCGSGKKYKKCCLAKDTPESDLMKRINELRKMKYETIRKKINNNLKKNGKGK
jgi:hypothetical protein